MYSKKRIGQLGEDKACLYLMKNGYKIIDRNFYCKQGEIDIVAVSKTNELVFVEVKTRRSLNYGAPCESVTYFKVKHIIASSKYYIYLNHFYNLPVRYDVIEIFTNNNNYKINHIINAFP